MFTVIHNLKLGEDDLKKKRFKCCNLEHGLRTVELEILKEGLMKIHVTACGNMPNPL